MFTIFFIDLQKRKEIVFILHCATAVFFNLMILYVLNKLYGWHTSGITYISRIIMDEV